MFSKSKKWWAAASAVAFGFIAWVGATAQVSMLHPRAAGVRLVKTSGGGLRPQKVSAKAPRAVVEQKVFDFGVMDPMEVGSHLFVVRNEGQAPLILNKGPTTCKCTLSETSREPIPPGGEGIIRLQWNAGSKHRQFLQTADVYTNDPDQKRLRLQVTGLVRMNLGAEPWELVYADVPPNETRSAETVVYSQLYDSLAIVAGESSLPGVSWRAVAADNETLQKLSARSAVKLVVDLPADLPSGHFSETLRLKVQTSGGDSAAAAGADRSSGEFPASIAAEEAPSTEQTVELSLAGNVLRRMAIYGEGIDGDGVVDLGIIPQGRSRKLRLLVKIYDDQPLVEFEPAEVTPSFLKVQVSPLHGRGDARGLYQLSIESPADAPPCYYLALKCGSIRLKPNHPRIGETTLQVNLAVLKSEL